VSASVLLPALVGALLGAVLTALLALGLARTRLVLATARLETELAGAHAELHAERRLREETAALEARVSASFARLSAEALDRQATQGRVAVESAVAPLRLSLGAVDASLRQLESRRESAYAGLLEQVRSLAESSESLRVEAGGLAKALRAPTVRGRWGELQLRRVVELAGMVEHCDFVEQPTLGGATSGRDGAAGQGGGRQRPDLVVRLPGGGSVVVDAKVPLLAYLQAHEATDEPTRRAALAAHAKALRAHVDALAGKAYWQQVQPAPDLVVLFVPGEPVLAAALDAAPELYEHALSASVLLATPTTLVGLLKTVASAWRQETLAADARQVCEVGRELHRRLGVFVARVDKVGRSLDIAVGAYNEAVGSLESRVLPSARRLADLGVAAEPLEEPQPVDRLARRAHAPGPEPAVG
jgi:DNA recombination protein RmuC